VTMAKDAAERKAAERLNRSHRPWSYQADLAVHLGNAVMMHWEELPEEVRSTLKETAAAAMHRQVTQRLGKPPPLSEIQISREIFLVTRRAKLRAVRRGS